MPNVRDWLVMVKRAERILGNSDISSSEDQNISEEFLNKVSTLHYRITDVFNYCGPEFNYEKHIEVLQVLCFYHRLNQHYNLDIKICYNPYTEGIHFKILQAYLWHFPQIQSMISKSSCEKRFKNHRLYIFFVDKNKEIVENNYDFKGIELKNVADISVL